MPASPLDPIAPYLNTLTFFAGYTILYKHNPLYRFVQSAVLGIGVGYGMLTQLVNYNSQVLTVVYKNNVLNPYYLIPFILGPLFLGIFSQKTVKIYRAASIVTMCVGLGVVIPYGPATYWVNTVTYATNALNFISQGINIKTVGTLMSAIAYGLALSYFFFTEVTEKPTRLARRAGRIVLLVYTAYCIVLAALANINNVQWKVLDSIQGIPATWFIPVGLFLLCAIDGLVFPLKNLLPRSQTVEAKTTT